MSAQQRLTGRPEGPVLHDPPQEKTPVALAGATGVGVLEMGVSEKMYIGGQGPASDPRRAFPFRHDVRATSGDDPESHNATQAGRIMDAWLARAMAESRVQTQAAALEALCDATARCLAACPQWAVAGLLAAVTDSLALDPPLPAFGLVEREAEGWALLASQDELRQYLGAIWKVLPGRDRAKFLAVARATCA